MPPDPVTALARKWCKVRNDHADWEEIPECDCHAITAAVHEALSAMNKVCGVCWTSSWTPIPPKEEKECGLTHPHEGDHARCECCWLHERALSARCEALEEAEKTIRAMSLGVLCTCYAGNPECQHKKAIAALREGRDE